MNKYLKGWFFVFFFFIKTSLWWSDSCHNISFICIDSAYPIAIGLCFLTAKGQGTKFLIQIGKWRDKTQKLNLDEVKDAQKGYMGHANK